tara:strand:+ start:682 stop:855 length:174 start_codon:yes stop_codon:yes gene_type:complete
VRSPKGVTWFFRKGRRGRSIAIEVAFCEEKDTSHVVLKSAGIRQSITLHITTARKPL